MKKMLAKEETLFPAMFQNLRRALLPLMDAAVYPVMARITLRCMDDAVRCAVVRRAAARCDVMRCAALRCGTV